MTTVPDSALFEADVGFRTALYDVSKMLPRHPTKVYAGRVSASEVYIHHSGRLGRPGFRGLHNSVRYVVGHRGWPGAPYHIWISREPVLSPDGRPVAFRCQQDYVRTYHAGAGPNTRAVAVALQGNTTRLAPSDFQYDVLSDVLSWYADRGVVKVSGHCEAPLDGHSKPTCPGTHAMAFLRGNRSKQET